MAHSTETRHIIIDDSNETARYKTNLPSNCRLHDFPSSSYCLAYSKPVLDAQILEHLVDFDWKKTRSSIYPKTCKRSPRKVLDLGTGTAAWCFSMAQECWTDASFVGMDLNNIQPDLAMPQFSEIRQRFSFVTGDVTERLPFDDGSFDYVHISGLTNGVPEPFWESLVAECFRVLTPGGALEIWEHCRVFPKNLQSEVADVYDSIISHLLLIDDASSQLPLILSYHTPEVIREHLKTLPLSAEISMDKVSDCDLAGLLRSRVSIAAAFTTWLESSEQLYNTSLVAYEALNKTHPYESLEAFQNEFCSVISGCIQWNAAGLGKLMERIGWLKPWENFEGVENEVTDASPLANCLSDWTFSTNGFLALKPSV